MASAVLIAGATEALQGHSIVNGVFEPTGELSGGQCLVLESDVRRAAVAEVLLKMQLQVTLKRKHCRVTSYFFILIGYFY